MAVCVTRPGFNFYSLPARIYLSASIAGMGFVPSLITWQILTFAVREDVVSGTIFRVLLVTVACLPLGTQFLRFFDWFSARSTFLHFFFSRSLSVPLAPSRLFRLPYVDFLEMIYCALD